MIKAWSHSVKALGDSNAGIKPRKDCCCLPVTHESARVSGNLTCERDLTSSYDLIDVANNHKMRLSLFVVSIFDALVVWQFGTEGPNTTGGPTLLTEPTSVLPASTAKL